MLSKNRAGGLSYLSRECALGEPGPKQTNRYMNADKMYILSSDDIATWSTKNYCLVRACKSPLSDPVKVAGRSVGFVALSVH